MGSNGLSFPRGQRGHHDHYNYTFPYIYGPPFLRPSLGRFGGGIGEWYEEIDDFQPDYDYTLTRGTGSRRRSPEISRSRYPNDHHDYLHQSRMAARGKNAIPFGKAMIKLHKVIGKAQDFYNQFLSNYDSDIAAVRPYAKSDVLNKLWIMKVSGKPDDGSLEDGGEISDGEGSLDKFHDWRDKVTQALKDAVDCKINEGQEPRKSASRAESMERLRKKVVTANEQIKVLLHDAKNGRDSCRVLLVELSLLKNLVDPEAESNQGLVKPGDYVDDQDDCGSGQGEDQDGGRGNYSAQVIKRNPWFTFCFVPVIPLSVHGYEDVVCSICNFAQPLQNRQDVVAQRNGGGVPLQNQPQPTGGAPPGWGGGPPVDQGAPKPQQNMQYG
ncbi:hypothetical protein QTJ16_002148 [Diplocarpon rosae]|uniref:Uncharacterized protein n=1 Tax=Diplocarpon rosae TaxID=946125 RepID=A0AAD9T691_9HELO|nr:hypothetical protein QTJ16_002148 [Diplocarpon rosae]